MKKLLILTVFVLFFLGCSNNISKKVSTENDSDFVRTENSLDKVENDEIFDSENLVESDQDLSGKNDESDNNLIDKTVENDATQDNEISDTDIPVEKNIEFFADFLEIPKISYTLDNRKYVSSKARIFYQFQPADKNPQTAPLFVFYNGGPGASSALLFVYNTSKKTGDQAFANDKVIDNSYSWTKMGNLLYIDARETGFSYDIMDNINDVSNGYKRNDEFTTKNFNTFFDGADFIRVILHLFKQIPQIAKNPVFLTGESYGGTRSDAILNMLLFIKEYKNGTRHYYDEQLFDEIEAHFKKIYGQNVDLTPSLIAKQFSRQILIQPLVAGENQFKMEGEILERAGSPMFVLAQNAGKTFTPCGNRCDSYRNALNFVDGSLQKDVYCFEKPRHWLFDYSDVGEAKLTQYNTFEQLIKYKPSKLSFLYAKNRKGAFRFGSKIENFYLFNTDFTLPKSVSFLQNLKLEYLETHPLLNGNLESFFGSLEIWDTYFLGINSAIASPFYSNNVHPYASFWGDIFLENIKYTKTFITHAGTDIVVYTQAIPEVLEKYYADTVKKVQINSDNFIVNYNDGTKVDVKFPYYEHSGHSVSLFYPEKLFNDVKKWIEE